MKGKIHGFLTALFLSFTLLAAVVSADMGPKPSVTVSFINMGPEECYCTLLSKESGTGPYSVSDSKSDNEIYRAFEDYNDSDGFYFLEYAQLVGSTNPFRWGYYPPDTFKVLLYYPKTNTFAVSGIIEKEGFNSQYGIDMSGVEEGNRFLEVKNLNTPAKTFISFLIRVIITLYIELAIAFAFKFAEKKQILLIIIVNLTTQILLNLLLNQAFSTGGGFMLMLAYIPLEIAVFVVEAVVYCLALGRLGSCRIKISDGILYSFLANFCSFIVGIILAVMFPWFG